MKKVFISVLSYTGQVESRCTLSLLVNIRAIEAMGARVQMNMQLGNCYLPVARSKAVKDFLETDCTDMIFVDADVELDRHAFIKLLSHEVDIIAGIYPCRIGEEAYPASYKLKKDRTPVVDPNNELIAANHVPTGCLRIKRSVFDKMYLSHPEYDKCFNGDDVLPIGKRKTVKKVVARNPKALWMIFDTGDVFANGTWYGEDVAFCKRATSDGFQIWIEPDLDFAHTGMVAKNGNFHRYLCNLPK